MVKPPTFIKDFAERHPGIYGFMQDIVFSLAIVAVIALALYLYAGMWPPMVSVNGNSMLPHMQNGDLVFIQGLDRGNITTFDAANNTSYQMYSEPGDVIVYEPYGDPARALVIHRAIRWVEKGQVMYTDPDGNAHVAPASGYMTLGDNNKGIYDQESPVICYDQPVQKSWILGVARFKVPYLGYLRSLV